MRPSQLLHLCAPALVIAACTGFDAAPDSTPDAGPDSGACETIFVSPGNGNDDASGCSPGAAMKTLKNAILRGKDMHVAEVHACAGVFDEPQISLNAPISIRGGYDCTSWQRPASFGDLTLGGSSETKIRRTDAGAVGAVTFLVEGADITRATHIEGLSIDGPSEGSRGTALAIRGGASPSVHEVIARGGKTAATNDAAGAIGIAVEGGSKPEIHHSIIGGGLGTGTLDATFSLGTIGINISDSTPSVHHCKIDSGSAPFRTIGVRVTGDSKLVGDSALSNLSITNASSDTFVTGVSAATAGTEIELVDSTIYMQPLACPTGATPKVCSSRGVAIDDGAKATIARNRISAGEIASTAAMGSTVAGVHVGSAAARVENNQIWAGNEAGTPTILSIGVHGLGATELSIVHNTIMVSKGTAHGVYLQENAKDVVLQRNLIGSAGAHGNGVLLRTCTGASLAGFNGNAFVNLELLFLEQLTATAQCDTTKTAKDTSTLATAYPAALNTIATTLAIIDGGPTPQNLVTNGWRLTATVPCAIANGIPFVDGLMLDGFRSPRTPPTSTGAFESLACP